MHLLAPWALVALVLVPALLVWGLWGPRGRRVLVGSLGPWHRALGRGEGRPSVRARLSDPRLWLDAFLIALLVMGCARPALEGFAPGEAVATVVVDRTASLATRSGPTSRAGAAAAMARPVLAAVGSSPVEVTLVPGDRGTVTTEVVRADATGLGRSEGCGSAPAGGEAWGVAVAAACRHPGRPVVVVTDVAPQGSMPANVFVAAPGGTSTNAGLERVATRVEEGAWWLLVRARASAGARGRYGLRIDGGHGEATEVEGFVGPGETAGRVLRMVGPAPATLRVGLVGPEDGFPHDDEAYLVLAEDARLRVAVVGAADENVRRAIAAREGTVVLEAAEEAGAARVEADVVVACEAALPPEWRGPAAMVCPPGEAGPFARTGETAPAEWRVEGDHPLAEAFYPGPPRVSDVPVYRLEGATRVLGTAEVPLVATWEVEGGRRLAVFFAFDGETTDWSRRAGFPVFWRRAVDWLAGRSSGVLRHETWAPLAPLEGGGLAPATMGFSERNGRRVGVSFIGSEEGFEAGAGRDDSEAAIEALRSAATAQARASQAELWPWVTAAALGVVAFRAWVAR